MSVQRLQRRNDVYYYRRRVPLDLVATVGKKVVQVSLHTTSLKEAKQRRTLRDLEWDAKFAACSSPANSGDGPPVQVTALGQPLSESELLQLVRDYVARHDDRAKSGKPSIIPKIRHNAPRSSWSPSSRAKPFESGTIRRRSSGFIWPAKRSLSQPASRLSTLVYSDCTVVPAGAGTPYRGGR